ncbi:type I-E CRISPR-associated protein Cas7/Cse4/CasC [Brevibacterium sp.]|uniref:type I-E CRISPR-associated protein Cas7/Cse4/CasC n=1 Tax=Brevibacterium sp. TaxID=1701 RepID=UPI0028119EA9|nr:type I-E CRISPR-associated protein Cas7/Cse4/CasC [Brevibacterium sp.]
MSLYIDIHALQTLPPSNINRDESGAPKSAVFGGVNRQRVSSQAWKRAIRNEFKDELDKLQVGTRTKRIVDITIARIEEIDKSWLEATGKEAVVKTITEAFKSAGIKKIEPPKAKEGSEEEPELPRTDYLIFLSNHQIDKLAHWIVENNGAKISKRDAQGILDSDHSIDIAMFGRMIADLPDYNVDASVQVAHAISVHGAEPEFDYFTAVDDEVEKKEETGAGMIGTVQIMSSTLYRYATINIEQLKDNLGETMATSAAVAAFLRSFVTSMPTGKINSFANHTLPEALVVSVRDDRPISFVNAFEVPVSDKGEGGRRVQAANRLAAEAKAIEEAYSSPAKKTFVLGIGEVNKELEKIGEPATLDAIVNGVTELVESESSK